MLKLTSRIAIQSSHALHERKNRPLNEEQKGLEQPVSSAFSYLVLFSDVYSLPHPQGR